LATSEGIRKSIAYKKETTYGVKASTGSAKYLRRVTGTFQLEKDTYNSDEIRISQQMSDMRHGTRRATGELAGEVGGDSYTEFIAAALRKDFVAGVTTGPVIVIAADETAGVSTFVRSTGSFITNGFKVGDPVTVTGFTDSANNGFFLVTDVTATVLTVEHFDEGGVLVTEAEGDSVTILVSGKKSYVPLTGHTNDSFTVEEFYPDSVISRTFLGMQVDSMNVDISANSMATINFSFLGKDGEAPTGSQYFVTPTAQGTTGVYSSVDGVLLLNGAVSRKVTSLSMSLAAGIQQEAVIGSNSIGATARGKVAVTVSGSAIFDTDDILGYFDAETEVPITYALRSADGTDCFAITMPRVKIGSATTDDGEKVVILSFEGMALEYVAGATDVDATTIAIVDTNAT
jgi:hypothetical protein